MLSERETWGSSFNNIRHNDQSCVVTVPRFVFVCVAVPHSHADDELGFLGEKGEPCCLWDSHPGIALIPSPPRSKGNILPRWAGAR